MGSTGGGQRRRGHRPVRSYPSAVFPRRRGRLVVNPGGLGQSKAGGPRARYAIWDHGRFELCALHYPIEQTVKGILAMPVAGEVKRDLIQVLRTGTAP